MRVALERLDLRALEFTSAGHPPPYRVAVREGTGVRGELVRDATQTVLRELGAETLVLDALRLVFGSLLIDSQRETRIEQLRGELRSSLALLELTLKAHAVHALPLSIEVGQLTLGAETELLGVELRVGDDGGSIAIEQLTLRNFELRSGEFASTSAALSAQRFELGWGLELRVSAARLEVPELKLGYTQRAKLTLNELTCTDLMVSGPHLLLGGLHIKRARYDQSLEAASEGAAEAPASQAVAPARTPTRPSQPARKAFDLDLLDGLSGHLQVDVQVDITIPIFGTRRAKHELRLSVEEGSVDYRELESNLAPLENALLDFSVRGSELVLEQGIPLLPTRGFGKPILRWHLSPRDRDLAERDRVRLALFPEYHVAGARAERDEDDETPSKFALRKLGLNILDFSLALAPVNVPGIALRGVSIERLSARGSIQHHISDVDPEGVVTGDMRGLALSVDALAVGGRALSLQKLQVLRVPRWVVRFAGLTPTAIAMEAEDIMLIQLSVS
ncbi:MAG TPA: hypothetical protein VFZ61_23330 [Polyangiales bacterium]